MDIAETLKDPSEFDEYGSPLYAPGNVVPPGTYVPLDRPWAAWIKLGKSDILPALLDGHQVRYARLPPSSNY